MFAYLTTIGIILSILSGLILIKFTIYDYCCDNKYIWEPYVYSGQYWFLEDIGPVVIVRTNRDGFNYIKSIVELEDYRKHIWPMNIRVFVSCANKITYEKYHVEKEKMKLLRQE